MADRDERDRPQTVTLGDTDSLDETSRGELRRLDDLDGWHLAEGTPDIRGWDVQDAGGRKVGEVTGLLVDTGARTVRYAELKLDEDVAKEFAREQRSLDPRTEPLQHVLLPIGAAHIDRDEKRLGFGTHAAELVALAFRPGDISVAQESVIRRADREAGGPLRRPTDEELERQPIADFSASEIEREAGIGRGGSSDPRESDERRIGP